MSAFKLSSLILFCFFSRVALSACETYQGPASKYQLCWDNTYKAWLSEKCLKENCAAKKFLENGASNLKVKNEGGTNPSAVKCHTLKLEVIVLKDEQNNEQSFCKFSDGSMLDSNATGKVEL